MIQKIPGDRWIIGNPPSQSGPVSPPPPPPRIVADLEDADRQEIPRLRRPHLVSLPCWGCGAPISSGECCAGLVTE
jgi:hypothetical protein